MITDTGYSAFSRRVHEAAARGGSPVDGAIELTRRCNLNCAHCFIREDSPRGELEGGEIRRLLDEISGAGCLWLLMTGGEPLTREDFPDIYLHAKRRGLIVTLFTNGTLIDESTARLLEKARPFFVEITLYGATRQTYESMTGVRGSYDACIGGIELLLKHNVPLALKTMITTINRHELALMKGIARSLGLRFRYDPVIHPRLDGSRSPYGVRVTPEEVVQLDIDDEERTREWIALRGKFNGTASAETLFNCGAGRDSFHITSRGRLRVCELVPLPDYDLRRNGFMDGFRLFPGIAARRLKGARTCAGCENLLFCSSCPGLSMLEGDRAGERPVDYHCAVASMRAKYIPREMEREKEKDLQET